MNYNYLEEACQLNDELVAYRRYLHANPELGLSLPGTKAYVMKALSDFGYQPLEYGESGVAVLAGGKKAGQGISHPRGYGRPARHRTDRLRLHLGACGLYACLRS